MTVGWIIGAGLFALLAAGCSSENHSATTAPTVTQSAAGKPVVGFSDKDADYQKAVAEARRTMPSFLKRLANPQPHEFFYVDAGLPTPKGDPEHIWIRDVKYADGKYTGVLTDEPLNVPGKHKEDTVTVDEKDVDDWSIQYDNSAKMEGTFTSAVLDKAQSAARSSNSG
jgi:uncharacterized protein YegJ (DUF2314 family)